MNYRKKINLINQTDDNDNNATSTSTRMIQQRRFWRSTTSTIRMNHLNLCKFFFSNYSNLLGYLFHWKFFYFFCSISIDILTNKKKFEMMIMMKKWKKNSSKKKTKLIYINCVVRVTFFIFISIFFCSPFGRSKGRYIFGM